MANTNLTNILFAGLIITFTITVFIGQYANFAVMNNSTIEDRYMKVFENISNQKSSFESIGSTVQDQGLVTTILNVGESLITGTVNVFVTGLKAMGAFFDMIPLWGNIISAISFGIEELSGLMNLLILIIGIFIAMHYIKSVSNKNDLP